MPDQRFDIVVIGGGIVGLSTAMQACQLFPKLRLLLVEKEDRLARHQTGHNSGVIHSGIYYKPGSFKARFAVEGCRQMAEFCKQHGIVHDVCGKIIVATEDWELPQIQKLLERGQANGVGVRPLTPEQIREIEPHCAGKAGLFVASTGIADYKAVSRKYAELASGRGAAI